MGWIEGVLFCDGCGAEISVASLEMRDGAYYCCARCANGERCDCGLILDDDREDTEAAQRVGGSPTAF